MNPPVPRALLTLLRASLVVGTAHVLFGAIVRITGAGMGCGDSWPRCAGAWFPPMSQPMLVIEWVHRLLAAVVLATIAATAVAAWKARAVPGVGGRGGVMRAVFVALALVIAAALVGMVTVRLANTPLATVVHWTLAAALLGTLTAALFRAGDLDGATPGTGTAGLFRASVAAAALALVVLVFGGLTAKVPGANGVCPHFPLCGAGGAGGAGGPGVSGLVWLQMTHRVLAFLLFFHLLGLTMSTRKLAADAPAVVRAVRTVFTLVLAQLLVAGAMIGMALPPALRSIHQMLGVLVWISVVVLVLLARRAAPADAAAPPSIAVIIARGGGA